MPLLSKRIFNCVKPLTDVKPDEKVYTISHTKETFRSSSEYEKRRNLYNKRVWTCQSTGHVNLTHEEAWNSEKAVLKTLKEQFAPCYDKPVLELVHHSVKSLETLVDEAWLMLQQVLVVGEKVLLKVKCGKSMKAVVVKVDPDGYKGNPTSNCNSPSSDKENTDNNASPKKWVPPKLLPYKYSIRFENEDSVIHSVPASDLSRGDKPPSKELLRLFIRTYAVRAGQNSASPWIVDDGQVKKLELTNKFANFLLSPIKWKADEISKRLDEEMKSKKSPSKGSPRIKTILDAKEEKRKEKAKKTISKIENNRERAKLIKEKTSASKKSDIVSLCSSDSSSDSDSGSEDEDNKKKKGVVMSESDSDSDVPLSVVKKKVSEDVPLAVLKSKLSPKKKASAASDKEKKSKDKKAKSLAELQKQLKKTKESKGKKDLTLADIKKRLEKKKLKELKKKSDTKKKSKKDKDPKQMTLLDMSAKKKGLKSPDKSQKSPTKSSPMKKSGEKLVDARKKLMSPSQQIPIIVQKLLQAIKTNDSVKIGMYATQAAKQLTPAQRGRLTAKAKEMVMKKYDLIQEKLKLSRMTEEEKKKYMAEKAEERKRRWKEKLKNSKKKHEDTDLDLKPLPAPKLVTTPDGLPNEAFGDITMVTEFISCYSGLFMPENKTTICTETLMKALGSGKDGLMYLSQTITVLLQTLLQDEIAEDYQELKVPLSDIPVNMGTCSELVRLCLRRRDAGDNLSDVSRDDMEEEENEVPDEIVQLLDSQEVYQLDAGQKLTLLTGLCQRLMGTYSVQDYMEEKQQELAKLWRDRQEQWRQEKARKKAKAEVKDGGPSGSGTEDKKDKDTGSSTLLSQFYGKKEKDEDTKDGQTSGNSSAMEVEDDDLISKIKRRRVTAAQAAEERRQKEIENKIRLEKEREEQRILQMKNQLDKSFMEGSITARNVLRQAPIGTDRNHSRYWIFGQSTPGLYIEKGWAGDEMEYSCCKPGASHDDDSDSGASSSDEENDNQQGQAGEQAGSSTQGQKNKPAGKCIDTTFPHVGQNLWFTYDELSQVKDLIEALHPSGARESHLKKELQKRLADIFPAKKVKTEGAEVSEVSSNLDILASFQKELMDTELKLRNGGLGGVEDFDAWSIRLDTATDTEPLAQCLLDVQSMVLDKFRDGIMGSKKKATDNEDEEVEVKAPAGIVHWQEAVKSASTVSRLHVLLGILDSCIKWEKSAEHAKCKICRRKVDEDKLLLCDDCNQAFHMYCLRPALHGVPKGEWKCVACAPTSRRRPVDIPGKYHEVDTSEDEEVKTAKSASLQHLENCVECGGDESLILCAECPDVYHLECHDPPMRRPPRGRWVCNNCKMGVKRRKPRNVTRTAAASTKSSGGRGKRKRYEESSSESEQDSDDDTIEENHSDHDGDDDNSDTEEEEVQAKPPPKKIAKVTGKTSRGSTGGKRGSTGKAASNGAHRGGNDDSPSGGRGGRRSAPSPEIIYESKVKASRRAPSELSVIEDIINKMLGFKMAWPFWQMVSKRDVPDYYDIIKQPISFQKIKDRLNCLVYGSPQEVIDATALLFRNAMEYNKVGSEVYDCIEASEKYFVDLLKKHLPFYAYSRDSKPNGYSDHMYSEENRKSRRSK